MVLYHSRLPLPSRIVWDLTGVKHVSFTKPICVKDVIGKSASNEGTSNSAFENVEQLQGHGRCFKTLFVLCGFVNLVKIAFADLSNCTSCRCFGQLCF